MDQNTGAKSFELMLDNLIEDHSFVMDIHTVIGILSNKANTLSRLAYMVEEEKEYQKEHDENNI